MATLELVGASISEKLVNVLGPEEASALVDQVLPELGLERLATPDDRLRFGEALVGRGGLLTALGRAIATQALLHGAVARIDAALSRR